MTPEGSGPPALQGVARRGLLSGLIGLGAVTLAMLAVSRTPLGAGALHDLAARARPAPLLLAAVIMSFAFFFMGLRWRALMPAGHRPPAWGLTAMLCAGLLLNYALPGPVGELGAAWFAHRRYKVPLADCLASGVAARVVGLASSALMATSFWALADLPVPPGYDRWVAASALVIGVGGAALVALAAAPGPWRRLAARLLRAVRGPPALVRLAARLDAAVGSLTDALAEVAKRGARAYAAALGWAIAGHGCVLLGISVAAASFGADADPFGLAFTYAMTTAGSVALFALPGSQVGWDALFVTLMVATAGLGLPDALAVAAVVRAQQLLLLALGAALMTWLLASQGPDEAPPAPSAGA